MSNFQTLLESENLLPIAEQVFQDSCQKLVNNLDEESMKKVQEYVDLLSNKKTKKSLENEISEALNPILERNTVLYGSFLYETQSIQEDAKPEKSALVIIRENSSAEYVANVFTEQINCPLQEGRKGKIAAGLGAAGAAGLAAHKLASGDDADDITPSSQGLSGDNPGTVTGKGQESNINYKRSTEKELMRRNADSGPHSKPTGVKTGATTPLSPAQRGGGEKLNKSYSRAMG